MAETFKCRPSDYFPELDSYQKFCIDEVVAFQIAHEKAERLEEVKTERKGGVPADEKSTRVSAQDSPLDVLNHESFRKQ